MRPSAQIALLLVLFGTAACGGGDARSAAESSASGNDQQNEQQCADPAWLAKLPGTPAAEAQEAAQKASIPYRAVGPGGAMTMDFNPRRLTILMDAEGLVIEARCG